MIIAGRCISKQRGGVHSFKRWGRLFLIDGAYIHKDKFHEMFCVIIGPEKQTEKYYEKMLSKHEPGCPKMQAWDGGEDVPCWCST